MLYEKKMLILSGSGKGVVLIEKSAHGVRFSLRTFDLTSPLPLKAGVVTRTAVYVRDLPYKDNPAAVFTVDASDIDSLHFAVFDRELRLYGAIGKRMWESNLMDLLVKHEKRPPVTADVLPSVLPPIAQKPRVLPMPDGTGLPQSRLAIYGDEALAENNFYTPLDLSARMPIVDDFLNSPRVLEGLAPRVEPHEHITASEKPQSAEPSQTERPVPQPHFDAEVTVVDDGIIGEDNEIISESDEIISGHEGNETVVTESVSESSAQSDEEGKEVNVAAEAAATATAAEDETDEDLCGDMPWLLCARYLKSRSVRDRKIPDPPKVKKPTARDTVRRLRESDFAERTRRDIDALFKEAQKDERMSTLLPDMEWVRVEFDGHEIYVGRSGNVALCYAVPGRYEKASPLGDEAQWLPADKSVPTGKGYWLIFQSLVSGEIIVN